MKPRTVVAPDGRKLPLPNRVQLGMRPCPGDAHRPEVCGMIDNCMICAPEWGIVPDYAPIDVRFACANGFAVPFSWVAEDVRRQLGDGDDHVRLEWVAEKRRGSVQSFNAYVAKVEP